MMNKSTHTLQCLSVLSLLLVQAFFAIAQDGSTAYNFLNVTPSSHVYALGGCNVSVVDDDINMVEQNPAMLGFEDDKQVGLNYMRYIGGTNFAGARYGHSPNDRSAWAVGLQYYGYGTMKGYDQTGIETGTFSANDLALSFTYSHDINTYFRGGISAKYIYSKYADYTAGAVGVDLGVSYYNPTYEFSASLVARNLGGQVKKFADTRDKLPVDVVLGATKLIKGTPFRLSITAHYLNKWYLPYYEPSDRNNSESALVKKNSFGSNFMRHIVLGAEYLPNNRMYIGIGYNYKTRTDMSSYQRNLLSGFSIGAGLKVKAFGFGVALAQPHTGATTFMLNVTTTLNELLR